LIDAHYDAAAQDQTRAALASTFLTKARDEWVGLLAGLNTCVSPVLTATEVAVDSGFASRAAFTQARSTVDGSQWQQLAPQLAGSDRAPIYELPDRTRTDCDAVLVGCGLTAAEITALRNEGAVA
jgi:alpha-methylacyl-CoA racemase